LEFLSKKENADSQVCNLIMEDKDKTIVALRQQLWKVLQENSAQKQEIALLNYEFNYQRFVFRRGSGIRTHDPLLPKQHDNKGYSATYQSIIMM